MGGSAILHAREHASSTHQSSAGEVPRPTFPRDLCDWLDLLQGPVVRPVVAVPHAAPLDVLRATLQRRRDDVVRRGANVDAFLVLVEELAMRGSDALASFQCHAAHDGTRSQRWRVAGSYAALMCAQPPLANAMPWASPRALSMYLSSMVAASLSACGRVASSSPIAQTMPVGTDVLTSQAGLELRDARLERERDRGGP